MTMKAIVLIKFTSKESRDAYEQIKRLTPVIESYMVYGRFDAVAILHANQLEDIRRIILTDIHQIPGVIETLPCVIVEEEILAQAEPPGLKKY
jgi:DNA-binding Lrp family transcriptional regulator